MTNFFWVVVVSSPFIAAAVVLAFYLDARTPKPAQSFLQEELVVICLRIPEGISEGVANAINTQMNFFNPDHWILVQPEVYFFFFLQKENGGDRSLEAIENLQNLKKTNLSFAEMRLGKAAGSFLVNTSPTGELIGMPIGSALDQALRSTNSAA